MRTVRCSFAATLIACPPSGEPPAVVIDEKSEAGEMGTATHAVMTSITRGNPTPIADAAEEYGVDADELGGLVETGGRLFDGLRGPEGCESGAEDELSAEVCGVRLTGHRDYWWRLGERAGLVDWKTGRVNTDHRDQVMGYAALMFANLPTVRTIDVTIAWLRDGTIEPYVVTREDMPAWYERFAAALKNDGVYRPGEHCTFCPRRYECPALLQRQRGVLAVFDKGERTLANMTKAEQIDLYAMVARVARMAEAAKAEFRSLLRDGPIVTDDAELSLAAEVHRSVDPLKGWEVLHDHFSPEEMGEIIKVSLSEAERIYSKASPRGEKVSDKRALVGRLDAVGAIRRVTSYKTKLVRK